MYTLTVANGATPLRPRPPASAFRTLRDWQDQETTGYQVSCRDGDGRAVTKAELRDAVRRAHGAEGRDAPR